MSERARPPARPSVPSVTPPAFAFPLSNWSVPHRQTDARRRRRDGDECCIPTRPLLRSLPPSFSRLPACLPFMVRARLPAPGSRLRCSLLSDCCSLSVTHPSWSCSCSLFMDGLLCPLAPLASLPSFLPACARYLVHIHTTDLT